MATQMGAKRSSRMSVTEAVRGLRAVDQVRPVNQVIEGRRGILTGSNNVEPCSNVSVAAQQGATRAAGPCRRDRRSTGLRSRNRASYRGPLVEKIDFAAGEQENRRTGDGTELTRSAQPCQES